MSMDRKKILSVVRGYLFREKTNTVLTGLFLSFVTVFLLIGNQLFANVRTADRLNAEALEGRQHATYSDISEPEFQKIKACDFVADAGMSFHLGQMEDGTAFEYIDERYRDLGAAVAEANIKQVIDGRWAQKEEEAVFTKNSARVKLLDTRNIILSENHIGGNLLIVDRETAEGFPGGLYRQVVNVWTKEGGEAIAASNLESISDMNGYSFRNAGRQIQKYIDSDHCQKVMHWFFIVILAVIGLLIYFNTVFANLLNRRNDFKIMHKIGIWKKEMYWMVMKEGLRQGCMAAGVAIIVQIALSVNRQESFSSMFAATDVGVMSACVLFPVFILWCMFHKKMAAF